MTWDLPITVRIDGKDYAIRNGFDYRIALDTIAALTDDSMTAGARAFCALTIFYEDLGDADKEQAMRELLKLLNLGEDQQQGDEAKPKLMDWQHDFLLIAPAVSRVLGYDVRDQHRTTHWFTFIGAYMEIGECAFATVVRIREKTRKGEKLEKWEHEFLRENQKLVKLPTKLTAEEEDLLRQLVGDKEWQAQTAASR